METKVILVLLGVAVFIGSSEGLSCMVCTGAAEYCPNDDEGVSKPCNSGIYNCYKAVSTGSTDDRVYRGCMPGSNESFFAKSMEGCETFESKKGDDQELCICNTSDCNGAGQLAGTFGMVAALTALARNFF